MAACIAMMVFILSLAIYVCILCFVHFRNPSAAGTIEWTRNQRNRSLWAPSSTQVHKTSALRAVEATMKLCNVPKFLRAPSFYGCFRRVFKHPWNMARTKWWQEVIVMYEKKRFLYNLHLHVWMKPMGFVRVCNM